MAEAGVPNMVSTAWFGLWAPAGVPSRLADKLAQDVERALEAPEVRERFSRMAAEPLRMSAAQFGRFVRDETESSKRFVSELGITPRAYNSPAKP